MAVWFLLAVGIACDVPKKQIGIFMEIQGGVHLNNYLNRT